jgi:hypothetical protein
MIVTNLIKSCFHLHAMSKKPHIVLEKFCSFGTCASDGCRKYGQLGTDAQRELYSGYLVLVTSRVR